MHYNNEKLLNCLREDGLAKSETLKKYSQKDWETVFFTASRHSVVPLLYHKIKPIRSELKISHSLWEEMQRQFLNNFARNKVIHDEMEKILIQLKKKNIPVIVLKGFHLNKIYENIALRYMSDIDLLVNLKDMDLVEKSLAEINISRKHKGLEINSHRYDYVFIMPETNLKVEIHWKLFASRLTSSIDYNVMWQKAVKVKFDKVEALALSPEDLLIYLCAHAVKHIPETNFKLFYDIFIVLKHFKDELQWPEIEKLSKKWGFSRAVYIMLRLVKEILRAEVSDIQLSEIRPSKFDEAKYDLIRNILLGTYGQNICSDILLQQQEDLSKKGRAKKMLKKLKEIIAEINNWVFLPAEEMSFKYSIPRKSWRLYFFYFIRFHEGFTNEYDKRYVLTRRFTSNTADTEKREDMLLLIRWLLSR